MEGKPIGDFTHNGLEFIFRKGSYKTKFENNKVIVYTAPGDWTYFQKCDICLDNEFVKVNVFEYQNGNYESDTLYLVYDYGGWNRRGFRDLSVQHHLGRVGAAFLSKEERHTVALNFGQSKDGKAALKLISDKIHEQFHVIDRKQEVKIRRWDQSKDVYYRQNVTKATLEAGQKVLEELADFLENEGYDEESLALRDQLLKALFQKMNLELNFQERFKKKNTKKEKRA